jgi:hypothetical protein
VGWSRTIKFKLQLGSMPNFPTVHLHWPTTVNINIASETYHAVGGNCQGSENFYQGINFGLGIYFLDNTFYAGLTSKVQGECTFRKADELFHSIAPSTVEWQITPPMLTLTK